MGARRGVAGLPGGCRDGCQGRRCCEGGRPGLLGGVIHMILLGCRARRRLRGDKWRRIAFVRAAGGLMRPNSWMHISRRLSWAVRCVGCGRCDGRSCGAGRGGGGPPAAGGKIPDAAIEGLKINTTAMLDAIQALIRLLRSAAHAPACAPVRGVPPAPVPPGGGGDGGAHCHVADLEREAARLRGEVIAAQYEAADARAAAQLANERLRDMELAVTRAREAAAADALQYGAASMRARACSMQVALRNEAYDRVVAGLWARPSLEHFELGELLGHGANAAVLRAMHASGTAVALKVPFPLAPEATTHQLVRYRGDFELLSPVSRLHAPTGGVDSDSWAIHIATFVTTLKVPLDADLIRRIDMQAALAHDLGVVGMDTLAMVTPLLGPSLKVALDGRRVALRRGTPLLAPHEWTRLALQLAKGLARCHAQWVVHRDVKPDNVLLRRGLWSTNRDGASPAGTAWCGDDDTLCVLVDFGTCLNCMRGGVGRFVREEGWGGTAAYMAPEIARALARGAAAVEYGGQDAWGLGMTLWSMLSPDVTGRRIRGAVPGGWGRRGLHGRTIRAASGCRRGGAST